MPVTVLIYGKPACSHCEACKKRLDSLNISYTFINLEDGPTDGDDLFMDAFAAYSAWEDLPVCFIKGSSEPLTYPMLMQKIKEHLHGSN